MITVYSLKPGFQGLLRPLVRSLAAAGITANQVTVAACVLSIATGLTLTALAPDPHPFLFLPVFLLVRMALNAIDGMLAREHGQQSALGAYLNELTDVISDAFLALPFAYIPSVHPLWLGAAILLGVIVEMTGVVAVLAGAHRRYDGPMGKSDRAVVYGALALYYGLPLPLAPWAANAVLQMVVVLSVLTIMNRVRAGLAEIRNQQRNSL